MTWVTWKWIGYLNDLGHRTQVIKISYPGLKLSESDILPRASDIFMTWVTGLKSLRYPMPGVLIKSLRYPVPFHIIQVISRSSKHYSASKHYSVNYYLCPLLLAATNTMYARGKYYSAKLSESQEAPNCLRITLTLPLTLPNSFILNLPL